EEHAAADGEAESAYRHPSGVRQREGAPERRVDDLGCSRLELPLLDERELREHDEISGAGEGFRKAHRFGIVVSEGRRSVDQHDPRMAFAPSGPPPGHAHVDPTERLSGT